LTEATFPAGDFDALELYEHRKRVRPVIDLVTTMFEDTTKFNRCVGVGKAQWLTHRASLGNLVSRASSVIATAYKPADAEGIFVATQAPRSRLYEKLDDGVL
jgi:UDP-glucose:glycoprotein glucosyltransferase